MGTRSRIAVMHAEVVKSVSCNWDGYLAYNGKILQQYYDSPKVNNLVALGDISSLGPDIGEEHPFSRFETDLSDEAYDELYGNMTTFYGRDRGEENVSWQVAHSFEQFLEQCQDSDADYYYIIRDGIWYCGTTYANTEMSNVLMPLATALDKQLDSIQHKDMI